MLTVKAIANIIQTGLSLTDEQIWIYNQRREIPTTSGLFVTVGMMGIIPFGSNNRPIPTEDGMQELLTQHFQETISINAFSRDTSAISRLGEIVGSLNSVYSQQMQETVGFKIGTIPTTMNDTSFLEGTSLLYRFSMTIRVLRSYNTQSDSQYFDTFTHELLTEEGQV